MAEAADLGLAAVELAVVLGLVAVHEADAPPGGQLCRAQAGVAGVVLAPVLCRHHPPHLTSSQHRTPASLLSSSLL